MLAYILLSVGEMWLSYIAHQSMNDNVSILMGPLKVKDFDIFVFICLYLIYDTYYVPRVYTTLIKIRSYWLGKLKKSCV